VKTAQPLAAIAEPIRAAVRAVDPMLPVAVVMPLEDRIAQSMRAPKFTAGLIATFAVVAGLLGIVGLYGVIAYSVARETRSIGVRLALGATPATVTRMVVKRGAVLAATGVLFGVGGAVAATKLIASQLFGVSPTDPMTYLAAAMTFLVLAVAVSWIPARRAAGTDAMIALRSD
jgi:ABC-type antimicrobial peptide transport system permease subunit